MLNYQSKRSIGAPSFDFWFTSSLIRIIADKPFSRGDLAYIKEIKHPSDTEWNIIIEVVGSLPTDPKYKEVMEGRDNLDDIPSLVIATTRIYLDITSDLHLYSSDNVEILLNCASSMNNNKSYTAVVLIAGKQGTIVGVDATNGTEVEWLITDNPKVRV